MNGFINFMAEKINKDDEDSLSHMMMPQKINPLKSTQAQSVNSSPRLNINKMFHDYMKDHYFNMSEIITLEKFIRHIKFQNEYPTIYYDIYLYLFNFDLLRNDSKVNELIRVQKKIIKSKIYKKSFINEIDNEMMMTQEVNV